MSRFTDDIAAAIAWKQGICFLALPEANKIHWRDKAHGAVCMMERPTQAMIEAGWSAFSVEDGTDAMERVWRNMVAAAADEFANENVSATKQET